MFSQDKHLGSICGQNCNPIQELFWKYLYVLWPCSSSTMVVVDHIDFTLALLVSGWNDLDDIFQWCLVWFMDMSGLNVLNFWLIIFIVFFYKKINKNGNKKIFIPIFIYLLLPYFFNSFKKSFRSFLEIKLTTFSSYPGSVCLLKDRIKRCMLISSFGLMLV